MSDIRFVTAFREGETDHPGLLLEDDGTVWLVHPDGSRTTLNAGGPVGPAGGALTGFYPNPTILPIGAAAGPIGDGTSVPVVTIDVVGRVTVLTSTPIVGLVNKGAAVLDFGAFPGQSDATVTVVGQTGILAGSAVFVSMRPVDSIDHTADEHILESLQVYPKDIVAGVGFTIHGVNKSEITEPNGSFPHMGNLQQSTATAVTWRTEQRLNEVRRPANTLGGKGTRIYGEWNISWMWV